MTILWEDDFSTNKISQYEYFGSSSLGRSIVSGLLEFRSSLSGAYSGLLRLPVSPSSSHEIEVSLISAGNSGYGLGYVGHVNGIGSGSWATSGFMDGTGLLHGVWYKAGSLYSKINGETTTLATVSGVNTRVPNRVRLRIDGEHVQFRCWREGSVEPSVWNYDGIVSGLLPGRPFVGHAATRYQSSSYWQSTRFDDLVVSSIDAPIDAPSVFRGWGLPAR